jgi:hypothetical protein
LFSPPEEVRDWANLLPEIVIKVGDLLLLDDPAEYIRMRAVCTRWRSSTDDPRQLEPLFFPRNWLLLAGEELRCDGEPEHLVNVRSGAVLRVRLPTPHEYSHHGNTEGLLVLHHGLTGTVCLLNPLTLAFVDLPASVFDVARPVGAMDRDMFLSHSIQAAGIVVDADEMGRALSRPVVVLSLTAGRSMGMVCAEPGDNAWRAVDMSCADDVEGELPVIHGGLSVRGRFYVPTCAGDVLTVDMEPSPRLRYVARMAGDLVCSGFNRTSYLVPSLDDTDCGMLLVRHRRLNGQLGRSTKFSVDLLNRSLAIQKPSGVTVFLPSVTLRSSAFPSVVENTVYKGHMTRLLRGDYL